MDPTRASLIGRARNLRDKKSWDELSGLYRPIVVRFAQSRGLRIEDAEDVAQDCLTALSSTLPTFEYDPSKGKFRSFVFKCAFRCMVTKWKKNAKQKAAHVTSSIWRDIPDEDKGAVDWERMWRDEHLKFGLERVKGAVEPKTYEAFWLTTICEQPVKEVCKKLGTTANHVYVSRSRVLKRLRAIMLPTFGYEVL